MKKHSTSLRFLVDYGEIVIIFYSLFSPGCWCEFWEIPHWLFTIVWALVWVFFSTKDLSN